MWVFWCPGVAGFAFRGWWAYLIGVRGHRYSGDGVKSNLVGKLMEQARSLFPVTNPYPLFGPLNDGDWMLLFAHEYQRGRHCGVPQGKACAWAEVYRGRIMNLMPRDEHTFRDTTADEVENAK